MVSQVLPVFLMLTCIRVINGNENKAEQDSMNCKEEIRKNFMDSPSSNFFFKHGIFPSQKSYEDSRCIFDCMFQSVGIKVDNSYLVISHPYWKRSTDRLKSYFAKFKPLLTDPIVRECGKLEREFTDDCDPAFSLVSCAVKKYRHSEYTLDDKFVQETVSAAAKAHFSGRLVGFFISSCYILNRFL